MEGGHVDRMPSAPDVRADGSKSPTRGVSGVGPVGPQSPELPSRLLALHQARLPEPFSTH